MNVSQTLCQCRYEAKPGRKKPYIYLLACRGLSYDYDITMVQKFISATVFLSFLPFFEMYIESCD